MGLLTCLEPQVSKLSHKDLIDLPFLVGPSLVGFRFKTRNPSLLGGCGSNSEALFMVSRCTTGLPLTQPHVLMGKSNLLHCMFIGRDRANVDFCSLQHQPWQKHDG